MTLYLRYVIHMLWGFTSFFFFYYTACIINMRGFVISLVPEQKLQHIAGQEKTSQLIMLLYSTVKDRDDDY